jgi:4-amino-4-deoxy-L-arabinose transferase-like glycosyltransferase
MVNKILATILVIGVIFAGFSLRIIGILDNHSFWADEAFVSGLSKYILNGHFSLFEGLKIIVYQPLQLISTLFAFLLLGPNEFAARIFPVIWGTIGIIFAYLLGTKFSNKSGGLLSAFLYAFSQLNLANATQAKPYTTIQTLLLIVLYLLTIINENKKYRLLLHVLIIICASAATLFNFTGILTWIPYIVFFIITYQKQFKESLKKPYIIIGLILILFLGFFLFQMPKMITWLINAKLVNNTTYLRELLWRNYAFISLPAIIGIFTIDKKKRGILVGILLYSITLLSLWNFKQYSHNVRYLIPFFGIIFVFFGVFWAQVGEKLFMNKSAYLCLIVASLLFIGGYKIVRKPASFYSPNADLLGDVQISNYKDAFHYLRSKNIPIYNDVVDAQIWYLDKPPEATFMKAYTVGLKDGQSKLHGTTGNPIYTSLSQFKNEMKKNPKGILVVEDWESFLPEDIKQYAKHNLKLEYRVEGLPEANGDNWPLEIYSWGL